MKQITPNNNRQTNVNKTGINKKKQKHNLISPTLKLNTSLNILEQNRGGCPTEEAGAENTTSTVTS